MLSVLSFFKRSGVTRSTEAKSSRKSYTEKSKFTGSPLFNVMLMLALMLGVSAFFRVLEWRRMNAQTQIQFNAVSYTHLTLPTNREV